MSSSLRARNVVARLVQEVSAASAPERKNVTGKASVGHALASPSSSGGPARRSPVYQRFGLEYRLGAPIGVTMTQDRPLHPLDPLTADEVVRAASLARTHDGLGLRVRVISVAL